MTFLFGLVTVGIISLLGAMSPGPDTAIIVKNSLTRSRQAGIATAVGVILGNVFYISLVLLGLGAIIASSVVVFTILKVLGALYLIYLGIKLLRSKAESISAPEHAHMQQTNFALSLRDGFLTNISNPKFMVFLLAVFTQVISPDMSLGLRAIYGLEIPIIALAWFTTLSFIITMPVIRARISGVLHHVERVTGAVLVGLGLKIAFDASR